MGGFSNIMLVRCIIVNSCLVRTVLINTLILILCNLDCQKLEIKDKKFPLQTDGQLKIFSVPEMSGIRYSCVADGRLCGLITERLVPNETHYLSDGHF